MKNLFKVLALAISMVFLTACSSGPSESDVKKANQAGLQQFAQITGINLDEIMEYSEFDVINKADQGNNRWMIEVKSKIRFKKSYTDFPIEKAAVFMGVFGNFQAGQEVGPVTEQFIMTNGSNGWTTTK